LFCPLSEARPSLFWRFSDWGRSIRASIDLRSVVAGRRDCPETLVDPAKQAIAKPASVAKRISCDVLDELLPREIWRVLLLRSLPSLPISVIRRVLLALRIPLVLSVSCEDKK
jgi:hypothetical protein